MNRSSPRCFSISNRIPLLSPKWRMICVVSVCLVSIGGPADAGLITSLFNTGVDASGAALTTMTDGAHGISDPHYVLLSAPPGQGTQVEVYDYDQWIPGNSVSSWITPVGRGNGYGDNDVGAPGLYDYRTTFDLRGFDPATALIVGQWAADNQGTDILINGHSTGQITSRFDTGEGFVSFAAFRISGDFLPGINTIDFLVNNLPGTPSYLNNPTGLRVEFLSATASIAAVPEPSTWVMSLLLIACASARRTFRSRPK